MYIGNLPYDITEDEVGHKFQKYGKIEQIRFAYNYKNKKFKGFAYIDFNHSSAVPEVLKLNNTKYRNRSLVVDFVTTPARKGYKINMTDEGNVLYNKHAKNRILKEKKRKQKERQKFETGLEYH